MGGAIAMIVLPIQPQLAPSGQTVQTPTVAITIYGGEIATTKFGFGLSPGNITSPGPTLRFKTTDIVKITFINAGQFPHGFEITNAPKSGSPVFFNAAIGSADNPLPPGQSGSVVFQPSTAGNVYYICPVSGHAELGMWGNVTIVTG